MGAVRFLGGGLVGDGQDGGISAPKRRLGGVGGGKKRQKMCFE